MSDWQDIEPEELAAQRAAGETWVLLDVREYQELESASISGSVNIPMNEIPSRMNELDPEARMAVICHGGVRSAQVCQYLAGSGFGQLSNVAGGIDRWSLRVDSSIPRY